MADSQNWEGFWQDYRSLEPVTETDLYFQVGRTVKQKPVESQIFAHSMRKIMERLSLNERDVLVDLCCGNGLCTYEFREVVSQIIASDFSLPLITAAKKFKSADNIEYHLANALDFLSNFKNNWQVTPTKYLMNFALAYFTPIELENILNNMLVISQGAFSFYITDVPNEERKWNFYNTEERKQKYYSDIASGDNTNAGMGRWWKPLEIEAICSKLELNCQISDQDELSDYRMDILIGK